MSTSARNHRRPIKKEKPSKRNPRKLEEQTLPKSINHTAAKYPSPPGVEGARLEPRATPARYLTRSRLQERTQTSPTPKSLKTKTDELIDEGLGFTD